MNPDQRALSRIFRKNAQIKGESGQFRRAVTSTRFPTSDLDDRGRKVPKIRECGWEQEYLR
ncbi:MAG TPA: hypothetical protein VHB50_03345, partial [Bryobacteraceae bacterium]|nr:hypothetical protein [Bryobacteraceae bacterium]